MNIGDVRKIVKLYNQMLETVCQNYQLSKTEASIINFLQHNPQKDTAADIVETHLIVKSQVSGAVELLIQKGLLERTQDTTDRRRIHLSLLPAAAPVTEAIHTIRCQFEEVILNGFSLEERQLYEEFSKRLLQNVETELNRGELQ
ncbi:MAG: MarR family transcriptional regulator [Butyricicoccus pullicaecorum]|nr:MarR family transcriptional regulator [Butyricicoccus pullicaecorum]